MVAFCIFSTFTVIPKSDCYNIINLRRISSQFYLAEAHRTFGTRRGRLGVICRLSALFLFLFTIKIGKRTVENAQPTY